MTAPEHPDIPEMTKQLKQAQELIKELLKEVKPHPLLVRCVVRGETKHHMTLDMTLGSSACAGNAEVRNLESWY